MRKTIVCASNKQICRQITNHVDTNRPALHPLILVLRVMTFISYVISSTVESPEKRYPHSAVRMCEGVSIYDVRSGWGEGVPKKQTKRIKSADNCTLRSTICRSNFKLVLNLN